MGCISTDHTCQIPFRNTIPLDKDVSVLDEHSRKYTHLLGALNILGHSTLLIPMIMTHTSSPVINRIQCVERCCDAVLSRPGRIQTTKPA